MPFGQLGFGRGGQKAGRLEIEVAANLEQYDRDMDRVKDMARETARESNLAWHQFSVDGQTFSLLPGLVALIAFRFRRQLIPAALAGSKALGQFASFALAKLSALAGGTGGADVIAAIGDLTTGATRGLGNLYRVLTAAEHTVSDLIGRIFFRWWVPHAARGSIAAGRAFGSLADAIRGGVAGLAASLSAGSIGGAFSGLAADVGRGAERVGLAFVAGFALAGNLAVDGLRSLAGRLSGGTVITAAFDRMLEGIRKLRFGAALQDAFAGAADGARVGLERMTRDIVFWWATGRKHLMRRLASPIESFGPTIAEAFGRGFDVVRQQIRNSLGGLILLFEEWWQGSGASMADGVGRALAPVGSAIDKVFGSAFDTARDYVRDGLSAVLIMLNQTGKSVGSAVADAVEPFVGPLRPMLNLLTAFARFVATKFSAAMSVGARAIHIFQRAWNSSFREPVLGVANVILREVTGAFEAFGNILEGVGGVLGKFGVQIAAEGRLLTAFSKVLLGTGNAFAGMGVSMGKIVAVLASVRAGLWALGGTMGLLATKEAAQFEYEFARVRTLLKDTAEVEIQRFREGVLKLARDVGIASDTINRTLYQTLSAMPQLAGDAEAAMEITGVAARVASTGFAEAETAIRAVTGILNAYNLEADQAERVADALFAAQDQGVTTFGEIAESIGRVSGLTAALGGSWTDLLAIIATVSPFIETTEVVTGIAAAEAEIISASPQVQAAARSMGIHFNGAAVEAKGLIGFLKEIAEVTEGDPDEIARLFGSRESIALIATLGQNLDELDRKMEKVSGTSGALAENVEMMNNTWRRQWETFKSLLGATFAGLGDGLDELAVNLLKFVNATIRGFASLTDAIAGFLNRMQSIDGTKVWSWLVPTNWGIRDIPEEKRLAAGDSRRKAQNEERRKENERIIEVLERHRIAQEALNEAYRREAEIEQEGPVARPEKPVSVEQRIEELNRIRSTMEKLAQEELGDTSGPDAFRQAMESVDRAMNEAVRNAIAWAEAEKLPAYEINRLYGMLVRNIGETSRAAEKAAQDARKSAAETVRQTISLFQRMEGADINMFADADSPLRQIAVEIEQLAAESERLMAELAAAGDELSVADRAAAVRMLEAQADRRNALQQQLRDMDGLLPMVEALGAGFLELAQSLPEDQMRAFSGTMADAHTAVADLAEAEDDLYIALRQHGEGSEEAKAAQAALEAAQDKMRASIKKVIEALRAAGLVTKDVADAIRILEGASGDLGDGIGDEGKSFWGWLKENAGTIEGVARGLLSVGKSLGVIGDQAEQALEGVIDLAEGIGRIASGDIVGGISQGIGGVINLVGGLFGESEADKRRREAVEANTEALKSNTQARQREIVAGAQGETLAQLQGFFADIQPDPPGVQGFVERVSREIKNVEAFKEAIREAGLSVEDVNAMLEEMGAKTRVVAEDGEITAKSLEQVAEELRSLALDDLFSGYTGQLDKLRHEIELFDLDDPAEKIRRYYDLLRESTDLDLPDFDLDTAEGRAAMEAALLEVFRGLEDLDPDQLGTLTPRELLEALGNIEGLLDEFGDDGPDSESFQIFRGITEITANRMLGTLTTIAFWAEMEAANTRLMVSLLGGSPVGSDGSTPRPNYDPDDFDREWPDREYEPGRFLPDGPRGKEPVATVTFSPTMNWEIHTTETVDTEGLKREMAVAADQVLGERFRRELKNSGVPTKRTVR